MSIGCHRLNCDMLGISAFNFNIRLGIAQTKTLCFLVVGNKQYVFISLTKQTPCVSFTFQRVTLCLNVTKYM